MPSFRAGRVVDIEVVALKEVDADDILAGAGDPTSGLLPGQIRAIEMRPAVWADVSPTVRMGSGRQVPESIKQARERQAPSSIAERTPANTFQEVGKANPSRPGCLGQKTGCSHAG
jgi:hypothetical protein